MDQMSFEMFGNRLNMNDFIFCIHPSATAAPPASLSCEEHIWGSEMAANWELVLTRSTTLTLLVL